MERNLNPVIIFSFSKKDCEKYALELHREDYTDEVEKDLISQVYKNAIESLSEDDRKLPQVEALLPLLKRGIGIHHGGEHIVLRRKLCHAVGIVEDDNDSHNQLLHLPTSPLSFPQVYCLF